MTRSTLTGDWGGLRNVWAKKGVTFDANLTQVYQGMVSGGKSNDWEYGGRGALHTTVDTQKLGLWPGGFFTLELEGNWNDALTGRETGALMTVNSSQLYPEPFGDNVNVPQLAFVQFLSHYVGVLVGKIDTTGGDANEFAHGKGDKQFMNLALSFNPVTLVATPYSTLAAGMIVLPTKDPEQAIINVTVLSSNGKASTSGFDDLSKDELTFAIAGRVRTNMFERTGHQLLGVLYSNSDFASLDQRIGEDIGPGDALEIAKEDGSWAVYYNFDQYVYQPEKTADRGIGVFGRLGVSDGNPNLMKFFASYGVGAKGPFSCRPNDEFGAGFYYLNVQSPTFTGPLATRRFLRDENGIEVYYSLAITPWARLTLDFQSIRQSQKRQLLTRSTIDTPLVFGIRQEIIF